MRAPRSFVVPLGLKRLAFGTLALGALALGCGRRSEGDPFAARGPDGTGGEGGASAGAGGDASGPPPLAGGQACIDDSECDDGIDCTADDCNQKLGRCEHAPDDSLCDNGIYCDGAETCSAELGCQRGPVISCSDAYACTIDTCIEETRSCMHEPRDADGDGDPPVSCGGTDCNDFDPLVSGKASERCGNHVDDNCNGEVDEADCTAPLYDTCGDALEIDAPGAYTLSTAGAAKDYAISCEAEATSAAMRDVVLAVTVPADGPRDVDIVATLGRTGFPNVESVSQTTFATATKAHLVVLPATVNAGDLLICLLASEGTTTVTAPTGWNALATTIAPEKSVRASAFYRVANGSEDGAPNNFTTADATRAAAQLYRITDWSGTPDGIVATSGAEDKSATPTPPDAVAPWGYEHNLWLSYAALASSTGVKAYPPGYTSGGSSLSGGDDPEVQIVSASLSEDASGETAAPYALDAVAPWAAGEITIRPVSGDLVLAGTDHCGKAAGETACTTGDSVSGTGTVGRLVLRDLAPGVHEVYVAADRETDIALHVDFRTPEPPPANETCGTSTTLVPGVPVDVVLAGLATDLETACDARTGDLVYDFDLPEAADVHLQAVALDDYGDPVVSLRKASCVSASSELTCRAASPSELFVRALPAGKYTVGLAGTGPAEVELVLSVSASTTAPATEGCADPPALEPGVTEQVSLADATDAVRIGCLVGAPDATYALVLTERSDVLLVERGSDGDTGAVTIAEPPCASERDADACQTSAVWPVRAVAHGVGPGSVRAVVETSAGNPATVTAFARPAANSVFVQGADECTDALVIPESGGRFEGNTANAYAQYDASCDYGGQGPGGGPEQMLKLTLTERRRVILDASGSSYRTLVVVRQADTCPGDEVESTCSIAYVAPGADAPSFSFVDTVLDPGSYYVQIDGYNGDSGRWVLEVFTSAASGSASE